MTNTYYASAFNMTPAQRRERNELCDRIVLASNLSDMTDAEIAAILRKTLPENHWLRSNEAWHSLENQLRHWRKLHKYQSRDYHAQRL